jgi:glycosyltransferase involved in cell wall biosynthesis
MQPSPSRSPFFSVVIPTKNRGFLVGNAIQSVLSQTFPDFEVVVADNDDTEATRQAVSAFRDSRLKYVRTGNLSMPDNWEAGCAQATGEYLCILEDKQVFKRRALASVFQAVERPRPSSVKWMTDSFDDFITPARLRLGPTDGRVRIIPSNHLLDRFVNDLDCVFKESLPMIQRGCIHRHLIRKIMAGPMKRLCHAVSPDIILGYLQLAYGDAVMELNDALVAFATAKHSNGHSITLKGALARQFTRELGGQESVYFDRVPIKAVTIPGTIFNDYLKTQELVKGRLAEFPINWHKYFVECHRAMRRSQEFDIEMHRELTAWADALAQQPESLQAMVRNTVAEDDARTRGAAGCLKRLGTKLRVPRLERVAKAFYRGRLKRDPEWRFANVMEYLEWEHSTFQRGTPV